MDVNYEKSLKLGCVSAILVENINRHLFGEVLTILDASISDPESRKASKSLVSQSFSRVSKRVMEELNNFKEEK
jgi:hypothetical protein